MEKPKFQQRVQEVTVNSQQLCLGELRLNASFYGKEVSKANRLLEENGYEIVSLGENFSKDVYYLGRQKRFFANANVGKPYMMPSELFDFPFTPSKFVYAKKLKRLDEWAVKEGWVLLTRSGKLGEVTLSTKTLENFMVSDDVIRIVPKDETHFGFLYAYLTTWIGKALLTKNQYGVAIDHIEPHHVKTVRVPFLPEEIQRIIHINILKVFNLREIAREQLSKSQSALLKELGLPTYEEPTETKPFSLTSSGLDLRFDASFHVPTVDRIKQKLQDCLYKPENLKGNVERIFYPNRFKRIYVEKEYGVPFLSGTQISQVKPYDLKFISRKVTENLEDCLIYPGWVLVTRSGTVGKAALAPTDWNKWAASEHVIRIIPKEKKIHSGFLTAFLQSEYGHQQIISKIYGGVVDEIAENDLYAILIPLPPWEIQERIGKLVVEAYELRELANKIENETVKLLENMLQEGQMASQESYFSTFEIIGDECLDVMQGLAQEKQGQLGSWAELKKETGLDEI